MLPAVALVCLAVRRLRDPAGGSFAVARGSALRCLPPRFVRRCWSRCSCRRPPRPGCRARARDGRPGPCGLRPPRWCRSSCWRPSAERRPVASPSRPSTGGSAFSAPLVPGSAAAGWVDPVLYVAAVEPRLLTDPVALRRSTWRLAWDEARRRWRFHAFRAAASAVRLSVESEAQNLIWTLDAPGAPAPGDGGDGGRGGARGTPPPSRRALPDLGLFLGGDASRPAPKGSGNARRSARRRSPKCSSRLPSRRSGASWFP